MIGYGIGKIILKFLLFSNWDVFLWIFIWICYSWTSLVKNSKSQQFQYNFSHSNPISLVLTVTEILGQTCLKDKFLIPWIKLRNHLYICICIIYLLFSSSFRSIRQGVHGDHVVLIGIVKRKWVYNLCTFSLDHDRIACRKYIYDSVCFNLVFLRGKKSVFKIWVVFLLVIKI